MWILLVIVVSLTGVTTHAVDQYVTKEACLHHKAKYEREFNLAYPGDEDWAFVCLAPTPR